MIDSTKTSPEEKLILFGASGAYLGCIPVCPGTFGSLWGIAVHVLLSCCSLSYSVFGLALLTGMAIAVAGKAEIITGKHDDPRIVIDEIAGMSIALLHSPLKGWVVLTGFCLFRFYDIVKIFPANIAQRLPGGYGIVLDDIVAGIYANLSLHLVIYWVNQ